MHTQNDGCGGGNVCLNTNDGFVGGCAKFYLNTKYRVKGKSSREGLKECD